MARVTRETRKTHDASGATQDDVDLALSTLREVAGNGDATPTARSAASRTLLEFYGYLGTGRTLVPDLGAKSGAEMTLPELRRRASELRKANGADDSELFAP